VNVDQVGNDDCPLGTVSSCIVGNSYLDSSCLPVRTKPLARLNPNLPEAHLGYADYLVSIGRFDDALTHVRTVSALDPLSTNARFEVIWATLHSSRRYDEMLEEARKIRELPPDFTEPFAD
jgi:tetratricopeptide (TPR) repeat protein